MPQHIEFHCAFDLLASTHQTYLALSDPFLIELKVLAQRRELIISKHFQGPANHGDSLGILGVTAFPF